MIMSGVIPVATLRNPTGVIAAAKSMRYSWSSVPTCENRPISTEPLLILPMPLKSSREHTTDYNHAWRRPGVISGSLAAWRESRLHFVGFYQIRWFVGEAALVPIESWAGSFHKLLSAV